MVVPFESARVKSGAAFRELAAVKSAGALAGTTQRAAHSPSLECDLEIHLLRGGLIHTHRRMERPVGNHTHGLFREVRTGDVQSPQCGGLSVLTDPAMHPHRDGLI